MRRSAAGYAGLGRPAGLGDAQARFLAASPQMDHDPPWRSQHPRLRDVSATTAKVPVAVVTNEVFGMTNSTRNTAVEIVAMGRITIAPEMRLAISISDFEMFGTLRFNSPGISGAVSPLRIGKVSF